MIRSSIIFAAGLAIAAPAFAKSDGSPVATVKAATDIQEQVSFADLDLRERRDRRGLNARVMRASGNVCLRSEGKFNVNRYMGGKQNSCEVRTYNHAQRQVAIIVAKAERGEPLPSMALVVSREVAPR